MNHTIANASAGDLTSAVCRIRYVGTRFKPVPALIFVTSPESLAHLEREFGMAERGEEKQLTATSEEMHGILQAVAGHAMPDVNARDERTFGSNWYVIHVVMAGPQAMERDENIVPRKRAAAALDAIGKAVARNPAARKAVDEFRRRTHPE